METTWIEAVGILFAVIGFLVGALGLGAAIIWGGYFFEKKYLGKDNGRRSDP